ncbi:helix-turn-helix transcriptional regulator [Lentzea sp. CC55]|uniref:helix-turn-helix domain-containing protein n=1 Tax=Lentzea sp. CC55 TaxID=2884909 RepID=UPI001F2D5679|nr:helix-turn-helix transcriptional regulator [Lentzea sp. CC55]MCG8925679.1 helix-turn-helix domain-containing protein [Lentzea sp. CC55]
MSGKGNPVAQQRKLLSELRQAREARRFTQDSVAEALEWSTSKVIRIEQGKSGISVTDLRALLLHYGITEPARVDELVDLARATKRPAWMAKYRGLPKGFAQFIELESVAIRCRYVQTSLIPGMLQTREYATAIVTAGGEAQDAVERGVDIRMHRQALIGANGPEMFFILDESALHRVIGSVEIMRMQLQQIKKLAATEQISVQIVPFSVGMHPAMKGSFSILEINEDENDFSLFLEELYRPSRVQDDSEVVREYLTYFFQLEKFALPASETPRVIDERLEHLGG